MDSAAEELHRGDRKGRGQPPERYGDWDVVPQSRLLTGPGPQAQSTPFVPGTREDDEASVHSHRSSSSTASHASRRQETSVNRRKLEAEFKAATELEKIKLEESRLKAKASILEKELELEKAKIDEELAIELENEQKLWDNDLRVETDGESQEEEDRKPKMKRKMWKPKTQSDCGSLLSLHSLNSTVDPIVDKIVDSITATNVALQTAFKMIGCQGQANVKIHGGDNDKISARRTIGKDLTPFDGNPEEWPAFISEFRECTELCGFSDRENLQRLKKCLKGKAKESVQALLTSPENVATIIETLELRFGKPSYIVDVMIKKAQEYGAVKEDKFDSIIEFATVVQNLATTMKTLKTQHHLSNPQLLKDLIGKLPSSWKTEWCRHLNRSAVEDPTVENLANWLKTEARCLSAIHTPTFSQMDKTAQRDNNLSKFKRKDAVLAIGEGKKLDSKTSEKCCVCCHKPNHGLEKCFVFQKLDLVKRRKLVKENDVCFGCLGTGHHIKSCRKVKECGVDNCTGHHHPLLHGRKENGSTSTNSQSNSASSFNTTGEFMGHTLVQTGNRVLYKILPVTITGPNGSMKTHALLDEGSAFTLLDATVATSLGITGPKKPLVVRGVSDQCSKEESSELVTLEIAGAKKESKFTLTGVRTKKNLALPMQSFKLTDLPTAWTEKRVPVESMKNAVPTILIGLDNIDLITTEKLLKAPKKSVVLGKTKLGWTVYGNVSATSTGGFAMHLSQCDDEVHQLIKEHFLLEADGIKLMPKMSSKEDERAIQLMESNTRRVGESWESSLLWKSDDVTMPDSKFAAFKRLRSMEKKMDTDPAFAQLYCEKIHYYLDNGYARQLTADEDRNMKGEKEWFLPHFGVVNPNKPGKLRFVFDAAAKVHGVSLNDKLLTGPDLLTSLPGCLIGFRQKKVGFSGDIKDFFHRVKIREEDQPSQKFLWRGMDRERDPDTLVMTVSIFGAVCSPYTSQAAKNKNAEEFQEEFPAAANAIAQNHYMDDYLDSVDSREEAVQLIRDVIAVHRRGGFIIEKFSCSDREVLKTIPEFLRANGELDLNLGNEMNSERVLGMAWNPNSDQLSFNLKFHKVDQAIVNGTSRPTKRQVLQVVMSLFDPLGILGHFTVRGKMLLQEIWASGLGWDDEITDKLNIKWINWIQQFDQLPGVKIARCYAVRDSPVISRQIHVFCDASEQGYDAVAYLRVEFEDEVQVSIIMSKTRVAPLKPASIPRLELQSALLASRLASFIKSHLELEIHGTIFWTDSKTVLCWLRSEARNFKTFVSHRVGEIVETTDVKDWKWVPTKDNVADDATRDSIPADLSPTSRWFNGPDFLKYSADKWPVELNVKKLLDEVDEGELELKPDRVLLTKEPAQHLPDITRFSSWMKMVRATAWVLKFVEKCRGKNLEQVSWELHPDEIDQAEVLWLKQVQAEMFGQDLELLRNQKPIRKSSQLNGLSPFLDDHGIVRMGTRILNAPGVLESAKAPMILHKNHAFTKLLASHYHEAAGHHGLELVLNNLRQKYWIVKYRAAVKQAWSNCQKCKNSRAKPEVPEMGQLPWYRVNGMGRPFQFTGLDYFGPLEVSHGRRREKVYGALFTCLTTRAVHLEIADSLTTDSAIMAIHRFSCRRGTPASIHSDNGTNLRGADVELKKALADLDQEKLTGDCTKRGISWKFIPPAAPHMGGSCERMVQSVKVALRSTLKERAPRREVLETLFAEAEFSVNSRPLTHVSVDPSDPDCLTPNHFLLGSSGERLPPGKFEEHDLCLRKQWRMTQQLANLFWKRWIKEYLPTLTRRTKWHQLSRPVEVGDIVIVVDDQLERNSWPKGVIEEVYPGQDGQVRVVAVKTNGRIFKRPVAKICVLDVKPEEFGDEFQEVNTGGWKCGRQKQ